MYPPEDWKWIASYSGGKDSYVLLKSLLAFSEEKGFDFEVLHHDTLVEYPILKPILEETIDKLRERGIKVHVTRPEKHFFEYMAEKNYTFPRWNFRWCCRLLKWQPVTRFFEQRGDKCLNLIAIRGDETHRPNMFIRPQSVKYMRKSLKNVVVASPLVDVTIRDVWRLCDDGLRRLYSYDGVRFGCWVCTVTSCKTLATFHPELMKIKYELVCARCRGTDEFISKLEEYKDILGINIKNYDASEQFPCNKKCNICYINTWKKQAKRLIAQKLCK